MVLSLVKDDLPWLYELGVDAYEQTTRGMPNAKKARQRVFEAMRGLRRGPWIELFESKETYMAFRELEHMALEFFADEDVEIKEPRKVMMRPVVRKEKPKEDKG